MSGDTDIPEFFVEEIDENLHQKYLAVEEAKQLSPYIDELYEISDNYLQRFRAEGDKEAERKALNFNRFISTIRDLSQFQVFVKLRNSEEMIPYDPKTMPDLVKQRKLDLGNWLYNEYGTNFLTERNAKYSSLLAEIANFVPLLEEKDEQRITEIFATAWLDKQKTEGAEVGNEQKQLEEETLKARIIQQVLEDPNSL